MGVLKGFLYFCAAGFGLAALVLLYFAFPHHLFLAGLPALIFAGLSYLVFVQAKKFGVQADAGQAAQFEGAVRRLADKNGGQVALSAVVSATGESQASAQQKMRELMGRGVCDLDFGPNGEQIYKLTPMDEARANLAKMSDKV